MEFCTKCHGGCCRALNVDVTGYDILKIYNTLDLDPFLFLMAVPVEGEKLDEIWDKTPVFKFLDLDPEKYYKLVLQSEPTTIFGNNSSKCIFLLQWDPKKFGLDSSEDVIARCGIYNLRPYTCRTFPAKFDENMNPVMQNPREGEKNRTDEFWNNPAYNLCPKHVEEKDYIRFNEQYYQDLFAHKHEIEYFMKAATKWNKNPDVSDNFIAFLEQEYSQRLFPPQKTTIASK